MGQATVEMPDPLQQENAAALSGNADDLLAQMAGEEIDRILADAQEPANPKTVAESEPSIAVTDAQQTIGNQLDALFHSINEPTTEPAVARIDEQLAERAGQTLPSSVPIEMPVAIEKPIEAELQPQERAGINQLLSGDAVPADMIPKGAGTQLILKPLVWLNAPFAFLSSGARNAAGKIAIITMANAIAILIYVLVFRRH